MNDIVDASKYLANFYIAKRVGVIVFIAHLLGMFCKILDILHSMVMFFSYSYAKE